MLELVPGVSRNTFRELDSQAAVADAEYRAKRPNVLARHKYTCQFCGVQTADAIEVHHLDCNHANNSDENLMPADVFCHPVHHIGQAAKRHTRTDQSELAGAFVQMTYMPDISQADLSHLMRTIGHVMASGTDEEKAQANELYQQINGYSGYVEGAWGTSKASLFAVALREVPRPAYDARHQPMQGIRVLFSASAMRQLAARFANEFKSLPIKSWQSISDRRNPSRK